MINLSEADSALAGAISGLGRLRLESTDDINQVAMMQAQLRRARVALERATATVSALEQHDRDARSTSPGARVERYSAVFEHALDAIMIADDDARYLDVNGAACSLLGYSREELLGLGVVDITPPAQRHLVSEMWPEFLRQGTMSGEYAVQAKSGALVQVEFRAVANVSPGEHVSILRDVTRLRDLQHTRLDAQRAERRAIATHLGRALDVLLAAKIDMHETGWRMAVPSNTRRVGAEIDAVTAELKDAIRALEATEPSSP